MKRRTFLQRALAAGAAVSAGLPLIQRWVVLLPPGRYPIEVVNRAIAASRGMHLENAMIYPERSEIILTKAMMGWRK